MYQTTGIVHEIVNEQSERVSIQVEIYGIIKSVLSSEHKCFNDNKIIRIAKLDLLINYIPIYEYKLVRIPLVKLVIINK